MKCPECKGCFERVIKNNELWLYCWLCNKYYFVNKGKPQEVKDGVLHITYQLKKLAESKTK